MSVQKRGGRISGDSNWVVPSRFQEAFGHLRDEICSNRIAIPVILSTIATNFVILILENMVIISCNLPVVKRN